MNSTNNRRARRENAARRLARKREQLQIMTRELKAIVIQDARDGVPETTLARDLGVSRATIRAWLGK